MSDGLEITLFKFLFIYSNPNEAADKDFLLAFLLHVDSKIWHSESSPVEIVISSGRLIEISGSKIISRLILFDNKVMMTEDAMYDDGVVMEAVVEKFVKYFKSIFHHNNWYFASYIFCKLKFHNNGIS